MPFYFWLGRDADDWPILESVNEEEFEKKIEEARESFRRWRDIDVCTGSGTVEPDDE